VRIYANAALVIASYASKAKLVSSSYFFNFSISALILEKFSNRMSASMQRSKPV
jgi:hypothetical protein